MGFRMRKSIKVAPGVRLSVSKSGVGASVGGRGGAIQSTPPAAEPSPQEEVSSRASTTRRASAGAVRARRNRASGPAADAEEARALRSQGREGALQSGQGAGRAGDKAGRQTSILTTASPPTVSPG